MARFTICLFDPCASSVIGYYAGILERYRALVHLLRRARQRRARNISKTYRNINDRPSYVQGTRGAPGDSLSLANTLLSFLVFEGGRSGDAASWIRSGGGCVAPVFPQESPGDTRLNQERVQGIRL